MLTIIECKFEDLLKHFEGLKKIEKCSMLELEHFFNMMLIFAFTWGVGG